MPLKVKHSPNYRNSLKKEIGKNIFHYNSAKIVDIGSFEFCVKSTDDHYFTNGILNNLSHLYLSFLPRVNYIFSVKTTELHC